MAGYFKNLSDSFLGRKTEGELNAESKAEQSELELASFYSATPSYRVNPWTGTSSSMSYDAEILRDLPELRRLSRSAYFNAPVASAVINAVVDNVVGAGFRVQPRVDYKALGISLEAGKELEKAIEKEWAQFSKKADAGDRLDMDGLIRQAMFSFLLDGEVFITRVQVNDPYRKYKQAFEIVDPSRIESPKGTSTQNRQQVREGVKLGARNQEIGMYVRVGHPGAGEFTKPGDHKYKYIPKNSKGMPVYFHVYDQVGPELSRGIPFLSPVLDHFESMAAFTSAVIESQKAQSNIAYVITSDDPHGALSKMPTNTDKLPVLGTGLGQVNLMRPGQGIEAIQPTGGGSNLQTFTDVMLTQLCAALGLPSEICLRDYDSMNYSSAKAALQDAKRVFQRFQDLIIRNFLTKAYEAVVMEALLNGSLPYRSARPDDVIAAISAHEWIAPAILFLDPEKEAKSSATLIESGLSTLAHEAALRGLDWQEICEQSVREAAYKQQLQEEYGIAQPQASVEQPEAEEEQPEDEQETDDNE